MIAPQPQQVDGFTLYAPHLANDNDGFDPASFEKLAAVEDKNFWFDGRRRIILSLLDRFFPRVAQYLEIGCGTGHVLKGVSRAFPQWRITGSEIYLDGLRHAAKRVGAGVELCQMDACDIPFENEFDVIGAYDCIEHIDDDVAVLRQINKALRENGGVILTVPQHMFLWSEMDDIAHHKRRYVRGELEKKLQDCGFRVEYSTSYVFFLFPLMAASRLYRRIVPLKDKNVAVDAEFSLPFWMNAFFSSLMRIEKMLIDAGVHFPFGGSRVIVARKVSS